MAAPCITRSASQNHELAAYTQTATDRRPSAHTKRHHLNQLRRDRSCLLRDKGQSARLTLVASTVVAHAYRRPAPSDCVISCIVLPRLFAVRCSLFAVRCSLFAVRCFVFCVLCFVFLLLSSPGSGCLNATCARQSNHE